MKRPLVLHLKAALLCALVAVVLALPLLWLPALPAWQGWRPPVVSPRVEAIVAVIMALWVAWCVVDIPRFGLKVLIWLATLWLLGGGIWLAGLYGYPASSLVPLTAAGLAGASALVFSMSPAGSRRARWQALVGPRVAPDFLRSRIEERHLGEEPRTEVVAVAEVLWAGGGDDHTAWPGLTGLADRAARHFQKAGGYLERCDAEGALFAFGCWGQEAPSEALVEAVWKWVHEAGGCVTLTRGECVTGVGHFPSEDRWTLSGAPLRKAKRMSSAARGYGARVMVEAALAEEVAGAWSSRRVVWWDFEGQRLLLHEITGPSGEEKAQQGEDLRRWDRAWEAFWRGDWAAAENGFADLARERDDATARVFALRSSAARRAVSAK